MFRRDVRGTKFCQFEPFMHVKVDMVEYSKRIELNNYFSAKKNATAVSTL